MFLSGHDPSIPGIDVDVTITCISLVRHKECPSDWRFSYPAGRPNHGLVLVLEGKAVYLQDGQENLHVAKDDLLYLAKGSKYITIGDPVDTYRYYVVSFDLEESGPGATGGSASGSGLESGSDPSPPVFVLKAPRPAVYQALFSEMLNSWTSRKQGYMLHCKAILHDIIYCLVNDIANQRVDRHTVAKLKPALAYMAENLSNTTTLGTLAEKTGLSITHFRRLFKQAYGLSPLEYLTNLRINRAKELIASDKFTIGEVAQMVGYESIYHFSRLFKKVTGETPSDYRKRACSD